MTLRARLGVAAGLLLVVLVIVGAALPRAVEGSEIGQVDAQLTASLPIAIALTNGAGPGIGSGIGPGTGSDGMVPAGSPLGSVYVARISSGHRHVLIAPSSAAGREPAVPGAVSSRGALAPRTVGSLRGSGSWRAVVLPLPDTSTLLIAVSLDGVDSTVRQLTAAVVVAGLAVLVVMALAGWWLFRLGLRPIAEVTAVADAIASGVRNRRVGEGVGGTEAAHLARAFNVMLDEQERVEATLRQFVADASHELRTPVAAIGGLADLWREGGVSHGDIGDIMRRLGQESSRMRGLVEDLLLLARLDEDAAVRREPVDLARLGADAASAAAATHPSRPVAFDAEGPVMVEGDPARLRQILSNLISNALIHTTDSVAVTVSVQALNGDAIVRVRDNGMGMTTADAAHAFDRFWRADASRTRGGSGLGLAIVRGIVVAHGGTVQIVTSPGAGMTVEVRLPIIPTPPP